jgi:hypothetical protein
MLHPKRRASESQQGGTGPHPTPTRSIDKQKVKREAKEQEHPARDDKLTIQQGKAKSSKH